MFTADPTRRSHASSAGSEHDLELLNFTTGDRKNRGRGHISATKWELQCRNYLLGAAWAVILLQFILLILLRFGDGVSFLGSLTSASDSEKDLTDVLTTLDIAGSLDWSVKKTMEGSVPLGIKTLKSDRELVTQWWMWTHAGHEAEQAPPTEWVIVLHGGPGMSSWFYEPLTRLLNEAPERWVVFYDQAGCGKSTQIKSDEEDVPKELLTVEFYIEEFMAVAKDVLAKNEHLEKVVIYGQSWGTILAQEVWIHLWSGGKFTTVTSENGRENTDYQTVLSAYIKADAAAVQKLVKGVVLDGALWDSKTYIDTQ